MRYRLSTLALACLLTVLGASAQKPTQPSWLSDAVFYQIYPSSFQDSDGDGYGDLQGIISRLDYIRSIGVTAIWLNPVYVSGWTDGGYDIIDYYCVDKRFGDNDDLVELIGEAHARGIKVVMDLVATLPTSASGSSSPRKAPTFAIPITISGRASNPRIAPRHPGPASSWTMLR